MEKKFLILLLHVSYIFAPSDFIHSILDDEDSFDEELFRKPEVKKAAFPLHRAEQRAEEQKNPVSFTPKKTDFYSTNRSTSRVHIDEPISPASTASSIGHDDNISDSLNEENLGLERSFEQLDYGHVIRNEHESLTDEQKSLVDALETFETQTKRADKDPELIARIDQRKTALMKNLKDYFAKKGDPNITVTRMEHGRPVKVSLLDMSMRTGEPEMVRMVLDHGAKLDQHSMKYALDQYRQFFSRGRSSNGIFVSHASLDVPHLGSGEYEGQNTGDPKKGSLRDYISRKAADFMKSFAEKKMIEAIKNDAKKQAEIVFELYERNASVTPEQEKDIKILEKEYLPLFSRMKHGAKRL